MAYTKKEKPDGFCVYAPSLESLALLPDDIAGKAIKAAANYFNSGTKPMIDENDLALKLVTVLLFRDVETAFGKFGTRVAANTKNRNASIDHSSQVTTSGDHSSPLVTNGHQSSPFVSIEIEKNKNKNRIRTEVEDNTAVKPPQTPQRRFVPPTLEEVSDYVRERGSSVDPQGFIDFYASKGWMVGKTPMKDWKAACRNAEHWDRWGKEVNGHGQSVSGVRQLSDAELQAKYNIHYDA